MAITYDTLGASITVEPTGVVSPGDLNTTIGLVGSYDSANANGSVSEGEVTTVTSSSAARTQFGADSELATQCELAFQNGAGEVKAVPVEETDTTESFSAASTGTLSNAPILDPRVTTATLSATDTTTSSSVTVNAVDEVTTPTETDTINLNIRTGEWEADSSSDYDISYTYGDFTGAIDAVESETIRFLVVCSANDSVVTHVRDAMESQAQDFRFKRAVVGADGSIDAASIGSYDPAVDNQRVIEVAPARGTDNDGVEVRTHGAIGGLLASQPIDATGSITYDEVSGLDGLATEYAPSEADDFERVTALTDTFRVAEGVTTSTEAAFSDIYKVEIIDFVTELLHERLTDYRGGSNAQSARLRFESRLSRTLGSVSAPTSQPPLLADGEGGRPYSLTVQLGNTDTETDVEVGIDPAPIAKQVNLNIGVGPIRFNGASV